MWTVKNLNKLTRTKNSRLLITHSKGRLVAPGCNALSMLTEWCCELSWRNLAGTRFAGTCCQGWSVTSKVTLISGKSSLSLVSVTLTLSVFERHLHAILKPSGVLYEIRFRRGIAKTTTTHNNPAAFTFHVLLHINYWNIYKNIY